MGRLLSEHLDGRVYRCRWCRSHLAKLDELISRGFHSIEGKAYLFKQVVNVLYGPCEQRMMTTGMHTVCDIHCNCCLRVLGWKYVEAFEKNQKYKEGKFILERVKMSDDYNTGSTVSERLASSDPEEVDF